MPGRHAKARYNPVHLPEWIYLSGETLTPGGASAQATLPSLATIFEIAAETQACYYTINGAFAGVNSPGFVATNDRVRVGPVGNLNRLDVYGSGTVHIMFFREG